MDAVMVRSALLVLGLVIFAEVESLRPYRTPPQPRLSRWMENLFLTAVNVTLVATLIGNPLMKGSLSLVTNSLRSLPPFLHGLLVILILDLGHYFWHMATHRVPVLWRLHRVHHCDRDMDVSTYLRFHPFELALGLLVKAGLVIISGATFLQLVIFEVVFNLSSQFHHSSLALPEPVEKALLRVVITPGMHRVHHSVIIKERNSNYGTILSLWDRLFGTFRLRDDVPSIRMGVGALMNVRGPLELIKLPFRPPVL